MQQFVSKVISEAENTVWNADYFAYVPIAPFILHSLFCQPVWISVITSKIRRSIGNFFPSFWFMPLNGELKKKNLFLYSFMKIIPYFVAKFAVGIKTCFADAHLHMQNHNFSTFSCCLLPKLTTSYSLKKVIDENDGWNDISTLWLWRYTGLLIYNFWLLKLLYGGAEICNLYIFCDTVNEAL